MAAARGLGFGEFLRAKAGRNRAYNVDSQRRQPAPGLRSSVNRGLRQNNWSGRDRKGIPAGVLRASFEQLEQRLMMAVTPVINEFMASNHNTINDVDGDSS